MALFKPFRGNRASLDAQPLHDGYAYFCVDDGTFHIDYADEDGNLHRKQINANEAEKLVGYDIATILNSSDLEIPTSKTVKTYVDNAVANVSVEVDATLTQEGKAADAKAVGDAITNLYTGADIYVVTPDGVFTLAELLHLLFQMNLTYNIQVVSELPSTLEPSIFEDGGAINLYVVRSTGIAYGDIGDGVDTLGYGLFQQDGFDKGWSNNISNESIMGVYCVGKIKSVTSWNDLTDKPFGEVVSYGDTITIDASFFEGSLVTDSSGMLVKASDAVPTIDDFVNGCVVYIPGVQTFDIPYSMVLDFYNQTGVVGTELFIIVPSDNFTFAVNDDLTLTFPEKGLYFVYDPDNKIDSATFTIPGYNGFETIVIKQIDEKYLPIFDTVLGEAEYVGDTLTWDGNTQGYKTVTADLVMGDVSFSITYVKVSDSILTKGDLEKGVVVNYSNEASIKHPNSYNNSSIVENENNVSINDASSDDRVIAQAIFAKKAFSIKLFENEVYIPEAGVWFVMASSKDYPQLSAYTTSLTVTDYNFIASAKTNKVLKEEILPQSVKDTVEIVSNLDEFIDETFFAEEQLPGVNIGDTLTWDGNLDGKTYSGYTLSVNGITQEMMYIRISDSVPTIEDLEANGWCVTTVNGKTLDSDNPNLGPTNAVSGLRLIENDLKIHCTDMDGMDAVMCFPTIVKKTWNIHEEMSESDLGADVNFVLEGDAVLEPGVYFFKGHFVFPNNVTDYQTKSFTLNNYNFLSTGSTKKVIKPELISVDVTLTESGKPADAKAVGDAVAELNNKINKITGDDSIIGTWVFNDELITPEEMHENHYCVDYLAYSWDGVKYAMDEVLITNGGDISYLGDENTADDVYVGGWNEEMFKTITIIEEPTNQDFITWLKANATKQADEPIKPVGTLQTPITHSELVALRDNSELISGMFYRITDYVCTTAQADTRAMDNKFDIIVQALSANTLSENASADYHWEEGVTPYGYVESGGGFRLEPLFDVIEDETGTTEGDVYSPQDVFVAYDYVENPDGDTVPVLYKTDIGSYPDEADYGDVFYYSGTYEFDGTTYDRWRKIDQADEPEYPWDGSVKKYVLTDIVIGDGAFIGSIVNPAGSVSKIANIPAWELKYCLDNDTTRFAWAMDDSTVGTWVFNDELIFPEEMRGNSYCVYFLAYSWDGVKYAMNEFLISGSGDISYYSDEDSADDVYVGGWNEEMFKTIIITEEPQDETFIAWLKANATKQGSDIAGKGVIYYMKDEHGNECPYDFKNIQFKRYMITETDTDSLGDLVGHYFGITGGNGYTTDEGDYKWCYTFSWLNENDKIDDLSIIGHTLQNDEDQYSGVYDNVIKTVSEYSKVYPENPQAYSIALNDIVFLSEWGYLDGYCYGCRSNTFGNNCYSNTFGNDCCSNTIGNDYRYNTFGNYCNSNTFGNDCCSNTIGNSFYANTFGNGCSSNTIGNHCYINTFGNDCCSNTFGNDYRDNTFGNYCRDNTFGNNCYSNTFGNDCRYINVIGDSIKYIEVGSGIYRATITPEPDADYQQIYRKSGSKEILVD